MSPIVFLCSSHFQLVVFSRQAHLLGQLSYNFSSFIVIYYENKDLMLSVSDIVTKEEALCWVNRASSIEHDITLLALCLPNLAHSNVLLIMKPT